MTQDPPNQDRGLPAPTPSPLLEANPASLNELFSRDPLGLSDRDLDVIIAEQRAQRARIEAAKRAGTKAPKAAKAPLPGQGPRLKNEDFSLDDLGLT